VAQVAARRTKSGEARYDVRVRIGNRVVNRTFTGRRDADAYARTVEADRLRGLAIDPRAGLVTFETYARQWVRQRPLRPLTRDLCDGILRIHILPTFGKRPVGKVVPAEIRTWYAELGTKLAPATTTRVYRLLHSIFATAVEDELIMRNPCLVRGASTASSPERPTATIVEVDALVEAMDDQYRAMVIRQLGAGFDSSNCWPSPADGSISTSGRWRWSPRATSGSMATSRPVRSRRRLACDGWPFLPTSCPRSSDTSGATWDPVGTVRCSSAPRAASSTEASSHVPGVGPEQPWE